MSFEPKIIFVDDDAVMRELLRENLSSKGYSFEEASNGMEGLKKAKALKDRPLLVISDYMMPGMDGLEMIKKIKECKPDQTQFIILTAYSEEGMLRESINIHIDGFLTKPLDFSRLFVQIESSLKDLKESSLKYFEILDGILSDFPHWLRVVDKNFNVLFNSKSVKKAFPGSADKRCGYIFGAQDRCEPCVISEVINNGRRQEKMVAKDGKAFKITAYPFKNGYDKTGAAVEIIEDITEEHRLKAELEAKTIELEKSLIFSRNLLNAIVMPIIVLKKNQVTEVNKAACKLFRQPKNNVIGRDLKDILPFTPESNMDFLSRVAGENMAQNIILEGNVKNVMGRETFEFIKVGIVFEEEEEVLILNNITKLLVQDSLIKEQTQAISESDKKIKDQFLQLVESEKLNILGILSAGIIHEINTPNTFIRGNMQMMVKYQELLGPLLEKIAARAKAEESPEFLDEVSRFKELFSDMEEMAKASLDGTSRIMKIVSSIRKFSKRGDSTLENFNILSPILDALTLTRHRQKKISSVYINSIPSESTDELMKNQPSYVISGSAQKITQVFVILINNSMDAFGNKPGNIQRNRVDVVVEKKGDTVVVSFKDNAGGIPDKIIGKIFHPFYTTKKKEGGLGLGLDILKKIVEEHDGFIRVASDTARGKTVFTLVFPLKL